MHKRYIGDGVFIEIRNGQFLLTCQAPSIDNGIFLDAAMIHEIVLYRDQAYRHMYTAAAKATTASFNNDPDQPKE